MSSSSLIFLLFPHKFAGARSIVGVNSDFQLATGPIYLDNVECNGDEEYLVNCSAAGPFQHDCSHLEDAGVDCEGKKAC